MPKDFKDEEFVFFLYANEGIEPLHIHVRRARGYAKFWLMPLEIAY